MSLLNLRLYYWDPENNIRHVIFWIYHPDQFERPYWLDLELNSLQMFSVASLLGAALPFTLFKISRHTLKPILKHTWQIWFQFRKFFDLNIFISSTTIPLFSTVYN